MIKFFVHCIPPTVTAQQKGAFVCGGKVRFFKKRIVQESENLYMRLFRQYAPCTPLDAPLRVQAFFIYQWHATDSKKVRASGLIPHDTRFDCDNISKTLLDSMGKLGFWVNDSRIADNRTYKFRGEVTGIAVIIDEVNHANMLDGVPADIAAIIQPKEPVIK